MSFLCDIGRHRPRPVARWNNGYYFTTCERCGCDLVRTPYDRWREPRGFRVVWQAAPPAGAVSADLIRQRAGGKEMPIEQVLRHMKNGDGGHGHIEAEVTIGTEAAFVAEAAVSEEESPAEEAVADLASEGKELDVEVADTEADAEEAGRADAAGTIAEPGVPASRIPDFMPAPTEPNDWELQSRNYLVRRARPASGGQVEFEEAADDEGSGPLDRIRGWWRGLVEGTGGEADAAAPENESQRARQALKVAIPVFILLFAVILWTLVRGAPQESVATEQVQDSMAAIMPTPSRIAYVTASTLNCRAGPDRGAAQVAMLARGDEVQPVAVEGDWAKLSLDGRQCWVLAPYLSPMRPGADAG